jgi:hypothetical protein
MTQTITILTTIIFLAACDSRQADNSSSVIIADIKNDSNFHESNVDTIKHNDRSLWTTLDFLNDKESPFTAEDSIIGSGIITLSDTADTYNKKLCIYNDLGKIIATIEHKESDVITVFNGKTFSSSDTTNSFSPRLYGTNPDYFRLAFDCISTDKDFYKVIIDKNTGQAGMIKKSDKFFKFETIEKFVDTWTGLGIDFDRSTNQLHKNPSDNSEIITSDKQSKYKIWQGEKISIDGDWIKIKIEDTDEQGWVRWRQKNKILIRMYYVC